MTIVNNIEIDNIHYKINDIKYAIKNNDPIEEKLNVILVISNPCLYARRYILLKEFVKRIRNDINQDAIADPELVYMKHPFINKNDVEIYQSFVKSNFPITENSYLKFPINNKDDILYPNIDE